MVPWTKDEMAQTFADVARRLQAEETAQETLQKVVDLAPEIIDGCEYAGISLVTGQEIRTPAANDRVPVAVDEIQYRAGQGPCLDALRDHEVLATDDLAGERRWPDFSPRAVAETGVRSVLCFRLFVEEDTFGALNLYSTRPGAFGAEGRAAGEVFAAHAAVALATAREHDRARRLQADLSSSEDDVRAYQQQVEATLTLQRSMLPPLLRLPGVELAARYAPAVAAAQVGGDWYDAFCLPGGVAALVVGDVAGHDIEAAVGMGQLRNLLRALAVDRDERPGDLLRRLDRVAALLEVADTATCVYARLEPSTGGATRASFANAGHPPPLLVTADGAARYLEVPDHLLLGLGVDVRRSTTTVDLPPGSTLLLYTDGLVEHRGRSIQDGLEALQRLAADLARRPVEELSDVLMAELADHPGDDVCLLALRTPF